MVSFLFLLIVFFASILQAATGFGFSIVATPFLLFLFVPDVAIQVNLLVSIVISLFLFIQIRQDVYIPLVKRLVMGSIIGAPLGVLLLQLVSETVVKASVGILLILVTILLILPFTMRQTNGRDVGIGGLSGTLTASIGMPGPPLLAYFAGVKMTKEQTRATTLAFFLIIYPISFGLQWVTLGISGDVWGLVGMALPVVVIGLVVGQLLFKRMNQVLFRNVTYVLLLLAGIGLLVETFL
ncbi:sulfite exporter TauE/SafE family protein [Shouchella sp. JSM 1781072]|uniref:sulfite exporter TauE/SafE family protein n=1 Tax=Shouchella sp. JSM 1781072 TaxID=3344581 RepID=UPI0035C219B1